MIRTPQQIQAINQSNSNLLISAGAGSGKTSVLSDRVIRILEEGIDLDQLIILTFTNAAAAEMRGRIKEKILERPALYPQLIKLENATISTFDSFCLSLNKQYHYLLGLPKDVEIADEVLLHDLVLTQLDALFEKYYELNDSNFNETLIRLFDKNDRLFRDAVMALYQGMRIIPNRKEALSQLEASMYSSSNIAESLKNFASILRDEFDVIHRRLSTVLSMQRDSWHPTVQTFYNRAEELYALFLSVFDLNRLLSELPTLQYPRLPRPSKSFDEALLDELKATFDPIKEQIQALKKRLQPLFATHEDDLVASIKETQPTVSTIIRLTSELMDRVETKQRKKHLYDFTDMMQWTISLFEDYPMVRNHLKDHTYEIMIDEYQDTNDLQDYLIGLIKNNNVFMVGDAKQSIYGFRNANPQNFVQNYHRYFHHDGGETIVLRENFRSRKTVIDAVNTLFSPLMDEAMGGLDYRDQQALVYGNHAYDLEGSMAALPEILSYHEPDDITMTTSDIEATLIADRIIRMIDEKTPILENGKPPHYRPVRYGDICILMDRRSDFDHYAAIFKDKGIPLNIIRDEPIKAATEVLFLYQLLQLIQCVNDPSHPLKPLKSSFYGVARSFVYQIEDDAIIRVFLEGCLESVDGFYALATNPRFSKLIGDLSFLAQESKRVPIDRFIDFMVNQTELYRCIYTLDNPEQVERKLDYLLSKIKTFTRFDLNDLTRYFELIYQNQELDLLWTQPLDLNQNQVKLMTIHKSKGLEFPVCFYPGLDKKFNVQEWNQAIIFHRDLGLIVKAYDHGFYDTIWHVLLKHTALMKEQSERIRLFYVAMTRAKEKLIFLLNEDKTKSFDEACDNEVIPLEVRMKFMCYHDYFDAVSATKQWITPVSLPIQSPSVQPVSLPKKVLTPVTFLNRFIEPVQPINRSYSKTTMAVSLEKQTAIQRGITLHRLFETFDFKDRIASQQRLTTNDQEIMKRFLAHKEVAHLAQGEIFKEYPFVDNIDGDITQGIIDLLIIYDDHVDVIDYKLKTIDDDAYQRQLEGYRQFLSKKLSQPIVCYLYSIIDDQFEKVG